MTALDDLIGYAAEHPRAVTGLSSRPRTELAIVTCMDARIDVYALFGLVAGDAHVIRNAGGSVDDAALHCLTLSRTELGTRQILLLHHEGCAALPDPADDLRRSLRRLSEQIEPPCAPADLRGMIYRLDGTLQEVSTES